MAKDELRDFVMGKLLGGKEQSHLQEKKSVPIVEEKIRPPKPNTQQVLDESEPNSTDLISEVVKKQSEMEDIGDDVVREKVCESIDEDIISEFFG